MSGARVLVRAIPVLRVTDSARAERRAGGVAIALEPVDQSWGNRDMYVRDPDGNTLRFFRAGPA